MPTSRIPIRLLMVAPMFVLAGITARSQTTNGGSTYSIFNLGDLQTGSTAAVAGRGGIEASIPSPDLLNSINPASWSDLRYTTVQASLSFHQYQVSDASTSIFQNDTRLREFAFGIRWSEKLGGAAGIAIRPYTVVNYRTSLSQAVPGLDSLTRARIDYTGRGGISTARIGGSIRPADHFSVGATANFFLGTIANASDVTFPASSSSLSPATYESSARFSGFSASVGAWIEPVTGLRIGVVADLGSTLTRSRIETSSFVQGGQTFINRDTLADDEVTIPTRITAGLSYATGRFLVSAEGWTQSWEGSGLATARNATRLAIGLDRVASPSLNATGFERWTFRMGAFLERTYYALSAGEIDAYGASIGTRWPITQASALNSSTVLDLALEGGSRGTTDNGLTREVFLRFSVGLSLNELWFLRRR